MQEGRLMHSLARGPRKVLAGPLLLLLWLAPAGDCRADWSARRYVGPLSVGVRHMVETRDCGWLVSGDSWRAGSDLDAWVMKLDAAGEVQWSRAFGGESRDWVVASAEAGDGGTVSLVYSESWSGAPGYPGGPWIVKLDGSGNIEWQKSYDYGLGHACAGPTQDGCVLILGKAPGGDIWLLKLRPTGEEVWQRRIQEVGAGRGATFIRLERTAEGGFLGAGAAASSDAGRKDDLWLMKFDSLGEVEWDRRYGGPLDDGVGFARQSEGGGYVVAGEMWVSSDDKDAAVLRLGAAGELQWQRRLDFPGEYVNVRDVANAADGGVLVLSQITRLSTFDNGQMVLVKFDAAGNLLWAWEYGVSADRAYDCPISIRALSNDGVMVGAWTTSFSPGNDSSEVWLLQLDPGGLVGGAGCGLTSPPRVVEMPLDYAVEDTAVEVHEIAIGRQDTPVTARDEPITVIEQCSAPACLPARCGALDAAPDPSCDGTQLRLALGTACGDGPLTIGWDLDGDTLADAQGGEVSVTLPPGTHDVTAIVTDSCPDPGPQNCTKTRAVTVLSGAPPAEVSARSRPPLRLDRPATKVTVEKVPEAVAYNVYADAIGSWYAPTVAKGSVCTVRTWTDNADGTVTFDYVVPPDSWILVTASTPCAEGPAGAGTAGIERTTLGAWELCGAAP